MVQEAKQGNKALERRIKTQVQSRVHDFWVTCSPGWEKVLKKEVRQLGLDTSDEKLPGGVQFKSKLDGMWTYNLYGKCGHRVWWRMQYFRAIHRMKLRGNVSAYPWELYINPSVPLLIDASAKESKLYHGGLISEEVFRGISDRFKNQGLPEPILFVKEKQEENAPRVKYVPHQLVMARFVDNYCQINLDCSGENLYFRGRQKEIGPAPLRDTYAASLVQSAARDNGIKAIIDPMCGSGTFSLEAIHLNDASLRKEFSCFFHPSFKLATWNHLKKKGHPNSFGLDVEFVRCFDRSSHAKGQVTKNLKFSLGESKVDFSAEVKDFFVLHEIVKKIDVAPSETLILLNPPYGERLSVTVGFFRKLGKQLAREFAGCRFGVIVPNLEAEKALGLGYVDKAPFRNGGLAVAALWGTIPE